MMIMKRGIEEANGSSIDDTLDVPQSREAGNGGVRIMFHCKTCGRAFSSFQALGGHRASHHKKPKFEEKILDEVVAVKVKAKMIHECSICGIRFGLGQALGGHMRRHRVDSKAISDVVDDGRHAVVSDDQPVKIIPVLMRSLSKRIMCMDLNLTPLENDLQILFGKKAPRVDCRLV